MQEPIVQTMTIALRSSCINQGMMFGLGTTGEQNPWISKTVTYVGD